MIYLTTGANGAGKTLNTLREVRELSLRESRPVYYSGFDLTAEWGWIKADVKDWLTLPEGSIFLVDECQNDFPIRKSSEGIPKHVSELATHRKRGWDFYLVTQHPNNLDVFIRRLIGSPGWHRHLKRTFGADMVSQLQWAAVNGNCEKPGAGDSGSVKLVPFPKDYYAHYKSAMIHTGKRKIPFQAWLLMAACVILPVLIWFAVGAVGNIGKGNKDQVSAAAAKKAAMEGGASPQRASGAYGDKKPMTAREYAQAYVPRLDGLQHTASAYDDLTRPTKVPVPAACVESRAKGCKCYTQDGTPYAMPQEMCTQVVHSGIFLPFEHGRREVVAHR